MAVLRQTPIRAEVGQWWVAVKAHQNLFFRLMALDSVVETHFQNLDKVIQHLEADVRRFAAMHCPESARSIRSHLIHAMQHAIDSLWCLRNQQLFECDVRFNIAQVDMTMLKHELLEQRVIA